MRWLSIVAVFAALVPMAAEAGAASTDDICSQLKAFEEAQFTQGKDGLSVRRWVEFQWDGNWIVGGMWGCRHSDDSAAKSFCAYLVGNTNQEFPAGLPVRVLGCRGYVFPGRATDWSGWNADIRLKSALQDRRLDLDVYLGGPPNPAVRISAVPFARSRDDMEPPALKDSPPLTATTPASR